MALVNILTGPCIFCQKTGLVEKVDLEAYIRWQEGGDIEKELPDLNKGERELLISGIHPECWELLKDPEE